MTDEQARLSDKLKVITRTLEIVLTVNVEITDNLIYQTGDCFLLCTDGI